MALQEGADNTDRLMWAAYDCATVALATGVYLFFLPYLSGERTPHADPDARGCFVGLTVKHGRGHLARAIMEGVAYSLRDSLAIAKDLGVPVRQIRCTGGGSSSYSTPSIR